jgi:hypothetical protein
MQREDDPRFGEIWLAMYELPRGIYPIDSFIDRVKTSWKILRTGTIHPDSIIFTKTQAKEFASDILKLCKPMKTKKRSK